MPPHWRPIYATLEYATEQGSNPGLAYGSVPRLAGARQGLSYSVVSQQIVGVGIPPAFARMLARLADATHAGRGLSEFREEADSNPPGLVVRNVAERSGAAHSSNRVQNESNGPQTSSPPASTPLGYHPPPTPHRYDVLVADDRQGPVRGSLALWTGAGPPRRPGGRTRPLDTPDRAAAGEPHPAAPAAHLPTAHTGIPHTPSPMPRPRPR